MEIQIRKALHKTPLFQDLKKDECESLINCLSPQIRYFAKNEIIILTGDSVHHVGIILFGTACAYTEYVNGSQTLISNLTPMSVFGEILFSTKTYKSPVTVYSTSDVAAAFIEYNKVYSMCTTACAAHRIFLQNMHKAIGDKYFYLFDRINILQEKRLRARIMTYLYALKSRSEASTVTIPFSKTMLADYLLVNRSALSKELRKMEQDGIISVNGREFKLIK